MAEYYGYAERDANAYVDWAKLGQNLTQTVTTAYALREKKKKDLDQVMEQNYNELVNAPSGLNQDINRSITKHVGNTKQFLLQANKLLKSGVLKPEDYTLIMQNQKEDNKAIFDNAKNWQTAWAKIQDDVASGKGSKAMLDLMSDTSSFGKFKDTDFMINPVTGRVNASKMIIGPDGERIKGESMTMQQLNVLMNQNIDKYKLTDKLVALEGALGENTISKFRAARVQKNGQITEITDKKLRADYDAVKKTFIDEITANGVNTMSILVDYKNTIPSDDEITAMEKAVPPLITPAEAAEMRSMAGKAYRVSTNANDFGKADVIYYEDPEGDGSFVVKLTDAQTKVVNKFASDQFDGLIDRKEQNQAISAISPSYTPEYILNRGDKAKATKNALGAWDMLRWGTAEQKKNAAGILIGTDIAYNKGLIDIDLESKPGTVVLKYKDASLNREIPITANGDEWSRLGVELHGESDQETARKAAGDTWKNPARTGETDFTGARASRVNSTENNLREYNTGIYAQIIEDDNKQTAANLNQKYKDLGFTFRGDYDFAGNDYVIIKGPDGKESERIKIEDRGGSDEIDAFIQTHYNTDKANNFFSGSGGGGGSGSGGAGNSGGNAR
jgi:hypothetical protein